MPDMVPFDDFVVLVDDLQTTSDANKMDIRKVIQRELSDKDIRVLLPGVPITQYGDLDNKNLSNIIDGKGRGIIFFVEQETPSSLNGHWLAVIRQNDGVLLFDPYGGRKEPWYLDHTWVQARNLKRLHEDKPLLVGIVQRSGYKILYNEHRLQSMTKGVETCGRHCVVRCWNSGVDSDHYANWLIRQDGNPDVTVSKLTYEKLGH